jgi:tRNA pseudouridine13 synthase
MKLKQSPDDFVVEELTDVTPGPSGQFALYRMEKVGWTTPDALAAVRRRWQLDHRRVGYGGLKDRHARTSQFFTVYRGPERNLTHERVKVTFLGRVNEPFASNHIRANRFAITLRSVSPDLRERILAAVPQVTDIGVPNYFDDQRFGSVSGGEFVAREMVFGRFESALKLALAGEYEYDRSEDKREKELLLRHWGDWPTLKAELPRGHARSLVDYLVTHPTDFKGAVARLRPELGGLYLAAYQSFLWNRILARWLTANVVATDLAQIELRTGLLPVPVSSRPNWESLHLPLPSSRVKPDPAAEWLPHVEAALAEEGLTLQQMRIRGMERPYFSKGDRAACVRPAGLTVEPATDDRHPGKEKLTLRFDLPRGSYATMVVKRLTV